MDQKQIKKLQSINDFPQLVAYLQEELDWPIEVNHFDDLTFDYSPEELGLDKTSAPKFVEIKRLRPLDNNQPWGIFFVKLEPKQLPVVALRRLLGKLVLNKRASANKADQVAWHHDDIMFISSFGTQQERQLSFAHFAVNSAKKDLPILKVMGWDSKDTKFHIDHVVHTLKEKLVWPQDPSNAEVWRKQWREAFELKHKQVISTSKEMAIRLAELARNIRDCILAVIAVESEKGPLTKLMESFRESLVHDLDVAGFADMYAQTIAYGLLSARIANPHQKTADDFAGHMRTNPFLRELMENFLHIGGRKGKPGGPGLDFDELGVSEVVQLLDDANMEAVVRDFGDRNRAEDPVMHFYESFLHEYNKQLKIQRGVFYTPQPVVSYIVRSVHELLQTEFGLADGLADTATWDEMLKRHPGLNLPPLTDEPGEKRTISTEEPFVQILDPATGTATFLVEVIDVIHATLKAKWKQQRMAEAQQIKAWNDYVPKHLLPRLHAYELMMAPYAIAHMKVGLKLVETGYDFQTDERARIYLTNALEPFHAQLKLPELDAIAREAAAVNEIKRVKRFTVVIGNPPYSGHSSNTGEWISQLVSEYYIVDGSPLGERNSKWLQDDYVKFTRLGQFHISQSGIGIQSFITNHGYIDNPTFRGMRQNMLHSFNSFSVLDLHGNSIKKESAPAGGVDMNVFDIKQGVAIFLGCRLKTPSGSSEISHGHLYGTREEKYQSLAESTFLGAQLKLTKPAKPFYLFIPQDNNLRAEYFAYVPITHFLQANVLGVQTHRDKVAIAFSDESLRQQVTEYLGKQPSKTDWATYAAHCTYRLFDTRWIYLSTEVCDRPRRELLTHVVQRNNLCLGVGRQGIAVQDPVWSLVFSSRYTVDANIFRRGGINIFPLYLYEDHNGLGLHEGRRTNFAPHFLSTLASALSLRQPKIDEVPFGLTPEDIFHYAYSLFHSVGYRSRYAEFLKIDFPRLPLPRSLELFRALAELGGELIALHLLESPKLNKSITEFIGTRNPEVEKASWTNNAVWVDKAQSIGFKGVPENVWKFHIGGYQVCEKWLKDRKSRRLSKDDIEHYQKIVVALSETIRLMVEIDKVIDKHGGWPGAFTTAESKSKPAPPAIAAVSTEYKNQVARTDPDMFDQAAESDPEDYE